VGWISIWHRPPKKIIRLGNLFRGCASYAWLARQKLLAKPEGRINIGDALQNRTPLVSNTRLFMKKLLLSAVLFSSLALAHAQSFTVSLSGDQESPPVSSTGTGSGALVLNGDNTLTYNISYSGLVGDFSVSHIHGPSAFGGPSAGILQPSANFTLSNTPITSNSGVLSGTTGVLTSEQLGWLFNNETYVNIHSTFAPGGELRGQIALVPEPGTFALAGLGLGALVVGLRRKK
jgi:hypothetical protein